MPGRRQTRSFYSKGNLQSCDVAHNSHDCNLDSAFIIPTPTRRELRALFFSCCINKTRLLDLFLETRAGRFWMSLRVCGHGVELLFIILTSE